MFMLLVRDNFKKYFEKKDEIKATVNETYDDGVELPNLKLYFRGNVVSLRNFIFLKFFYMSNQLLNYDHFLILV